MSSPQCLCCPLLWSQDLAAGTRIQTHPCGQWLLASRGVGMAAGLGLPQASIYGMVFRARQRTVALGQKGIADFLALRVIK